MICDKHPWGCFTGGMYPGAIPSILRVTPVAPGIPGRGQPWADVETTLGC